MNEELTGFEVKDYKNFFFKVFVKKDISIRRKYSVLLEKTINLRKLVLHKGRKFRYFTVEDLNKALAVKKKELEDKDSKVAYYKRLESYKFSLNLVNEFNEFLGEYYGK
jgi:hypothetical protein